MNAYNVFVAYYSFISCFTLMTTKFKGKLFLLIKMHIPCSSTPSYFHEERIKMRKDTKVLNTHTHTHTNTRTHKRILTPLTYRCGCSISSADILPHTLCPSFFRGHHSSGPSHLAAYGFDV